MGLAAAIKLTPLLFVAYLLVTRRFRAAATALLTFAGAAALGFLVDPADSVGYWWRGTFAEAGRISDVAGPSNHSLNGLVARVLVPLAVVLWRRRAWILLACVLAATVAVITALPGPGVGPIPATGLISLAPDVYVALFVLVLSAVALRRNDEGPAG